VSRNLKVIEEFEELGNFKRKALKGIAKCEVIIRSCGKSWRHKEELLTKGLRSCRFSFAETQLAQLM
jgi:hypothetical protein